jgi:tripeptide aminopeptidase
MIIDALPQAESRRRGRPFRLLLPAGSQRALQGELNVVLRDFDLKNRETDPSVRHRRRDGIAYGAPSTGGQTPVLHMWRKRTSIPRCAIHLAGRKELGMPLFENLIRGGTDGARMANERHIPCPNLFTGGHNLHSVYEWAALPAMEDSVKLVSRIIEIGARG